MGQSTSSQNGAAPHTTTASVAATDAARGASRASAASVPASTSPTPRSCKVRTTISSDRQGHKQQRDPRTLQHAPKSPLQQEETQTTACSSPSDTLRFPSSVSTPKSCDRGTLSRAARQQASGRRPLSPSQSCSGQMNGFAKTKATKRQTTGKDPLPFAFDHGNSHQFPSLVAGSYKLCVQTEVQGESDVATGPQVSAKAGMPRTFQASYPMFAASSHGSGLPCTTRVGGELAPADTSFHSSLQSAVLGRPLDTECPSSGSSFTFFNIGSPSVAQGSGRNRFSRSVPNSATVSNTFDDEGNGDLAPFPAAPTQAGTTNGASAQCTYSTSCIPSNFPAESSSGMLPHYCASVKTGHGHSGAVAIRDGKVTTPNDSEPKLSFAHPAPFKFQPSSSQLSGRPPPGHAGRAQTKSGSLGRLAKEEQSNSHLSANVRFKNSITEADLVFADARSGIEPTTNQQQILNTVVPAASFTPQLINDLAAGFSALSINDHESEVQTKTPLSTTVTGHRNYSLLFGGISNPATIPMQSKIALVPASIHDDSFQPITTSTPSVSPSWTAIRSDFPIRSDDLNSKLALDCKGSCPTRVFSTPAKLKLYSTLPSHISVARPSKRGVDSQGVLRPAGVRPGAPKSKVAEDYSADTSLSTSTSSSDASEARAKLRRKNQSSSIQHELVLESSNSSGEDSISENEANTERKDGQRRTSFHASRRGRKACAFKRRITTGKDYFGEARAANGASVRSSFWESGSLQSIHKPTGVAGLNLSQQGISKQGAMAEYANFEFSFEVPVRTYLRGGTGTEVHMAMLCKVPNGSCTHEDQDESDDASTYDGGFKTSALNIPCLLEDSEDLRRSQDLRRQQISKESQSTRGSLQPPPLRQPEKTRCQMQKKQTSTTAVWASGTARLCQKKSPEDQSTTASFSKAGLPPASDCIPPLHARVGGRSATQLRFRQELPKEKQGAKSFNLLQKQTEGQRQPLKHLRPPATQPQEKEQEKTATVPCPSATDPIPSANQEAAPTSVPPSVVTARTAAKTVAGIGANTVKSLVNFFSSVEQGTVGGSSTKPSSAIVAFGGQKAKSSVRPLSSKQSISAACESAVRRSSPKEAQWKDRQEPQKLKAPIETSQAECTQEGKRSLDVAPIVAAVPLVRTTKQAASSPQNWQPDNTLPLLRPRSASLTTIPPYLTNGKQRTTQAKSSPTATQNTVDAARSAVPVFPEGRSGLQLQRQTPGSGAQGSCAASALNISADTNAKAKGLANNSSRRQLQKESPTDSTDLLGRLGDMLVSGDKLASGHASGSGSSEKSLYLGKGRRPPFEVRRRKFLSLKPTDWVCAFCEYEHSLCMEGDYSTPRSLRVATARAADASARLAGNRNTSRKKKSVDKSSSTGNKAARVKASTPVIRPIGGRTVGLANQKCKSTSAGPGPKPTIAGFIAAEQAASSASQRHCRAQDELSVD